MKQDSAAMATRGSESWAQLKRENNALRGKVMWVDAQTQETVSKLVALVDGAQATLLAGEDIRTVWRLLAAIREAADDHVSLINREAEVLGANYRSENDDDKLAASAICNRWRITGAAATS